jgi:hypothetical protein
MQIGGDTPVTLVFSPKSVLIEHFFNSYDERVRVARTPEPARSFFTWGNWLTNARSP